MHLRTSKAACQTYTWGVWHAADGSESQPEPGPAVAVAGRSLATLKRADHRHSDQ